MNAGTPYVSMKCSFVIAIVSAETTSPQSFPSTFSEFDATAYPMRSCTSSSTPPVESPCWYQPGSHPPPKV